MCEGHGLAPAEPSPSSRAPELELAPLAEGISIREVRILCRHYTITDVVSFRICLQFFCEKQTPPGNGFLFTFALSKFR